MKSADDVSLLAGLPSQIFMAFPCSLAYILGYEGTKILLLKRFPKKYHWIVHLIGGMMAEIFANSIRNPFEVIKQQMQIGLDPTVL